MATDLAPALSADSAVPGGGPASSSALNLSRCGEVYGALQSGRLHERYGFLDADHPLPFEAACVPFVLAGRARSASNAAVEGARREATPLLSASAQRAFERELLCSLSRTALQVLEHESALVAGLAGSFPWQETSEGSSVALVSALLGAGRWRDVLTAYPELTRLLALQVEQESQRRLEFQTRAERSGLGRIAAVRPARSDPHHGGRRVLCVDFEETRRVYKPRPMAMERRFQDVLSAVNRLGFSRPLRILDVIDSGDHGWMEEVVPSPCRDDVEERALQYRLGGLLCLLSLLQALDIHRENVIFAGDQPLVVDLETLVHPRFPHALSSALGAGAARHAEASAWQETGIVAVPAPPGHDDFADTSVFGALTVPRRADEVIAGYGEMSRLLSAQRALLRPLIETFAGEIGRIILRSTHAYQLLLNRSLHPELLRDGRARAESFAVLSRHFGEEHRSAAAPLAAVAGVERVALMNLDIPYFTARTDRLAPRLTPPLGLPSDASESDSALWSSAAIDDVRARLERVHVGLPERLAALDSWLEGYSDPPQTSGVHRTGLTE